MEGNPHAQSLDESLAKRRQQLGRAVQSFWIAELHRQQAALSNEMILIANA
jgi:hypothetical protein